MDYHPLFDESKLKKSRLTDLLEEDDQQLSSRVNNLITPGPLEENLLMNQLVSDVIELKTMAKDDKKKIIFTFITLAATLLFFQSIEGPIKSTEVKTVIQTKEILKKPLPYYVSMKYVNLRETPTTKGQLIKTIAPNQRLEIIEIESHWGKFQYTDYINDQKKTGWAYLENLKRQN